MVIDDPEGEWRAVGARTPYSNSSKGKHGQVTSHAYSHASGNELSRTMYRAEME